MSHWKRVLAAPLLRQAPTAACCRIANAGPRPTAGKERVPGSVPWPAWHARGKNAHVSSLACRIGRDTTQGLHSATNPFRRPFSSEGGNNGPPDAAISECAESMKRTAQGGTALEVARLLSPSARKEIAEAARRVAAPPTSSAAAETTEEVPDPPTKRDLKLVALNQAIPFVGFGFMDNAILILVGDAIDNYFGVMLGISTLCAAALGNIVSDLAGVGLGTIIEDYCSRLGIPQPNLSQAQRQLRSVRFSSQFGCAFGLVIGCVLGMVPLLFLDTEKVEKAKHNAHMDDIFRDMVTEAKELIGAEHTCLFLVVDSNHDTSPAEFTRREERREGYLYSKYADGSTSKDAAKHSHAPLGNDAASRAALSGKVLNIHDTGRETDFSYNRDTLQAVPPERVKNILCVPVFDAHGNVIAVIQAINKVAEGSVINGQTTKDRGFTSDDIRVLRALATRLGISFERMGENESVRLSDTIEIIRKHGSASLGAYQTKGSDPQEDSSSS